MKSAEQTIAEAVAALDWSREPQGLYAPIGYTLSSGGKRIRPVLALLAARMFGGQDSDVLPAALALEVFHNFTLLHDDLMDRSDMRRGRPTVHVRWGANTAVLSGDQMLIEAYSLLARVSADRLPQVLRWFNEMATQICEGQQYDVDFEQRDDVNVRDYIHMIRLKTSVLLANALRTGAYIAGADEQHYNTLYHIGINLGLAFQLRDDLLDVYGDPATFGKPIGGDICCNKKTYLLIDACNHAQGETAEELRRWLRTDTFRREDKIAAVTDIYNRLDVRAHVETDIEAYTQQALGLFDTLPDCPEREQLRQLADQLLNRTV